MNRRTAILLVASLLVLGVASWHRLYLAPLPGPIFEFSGDTMGTRFRVSVAAPALSRIEHAEISARIRERLAAVNGQMSTWDPESELSRFNRHAATTPFRVSEDLLRVFTAARQVSTMSGGAFDVTISPLVQAWGFGAEARVPGGPSEQELALLRERVGWGRVWVDSAAGSIEKTHPDTVCDLSAIAKGYAVDRLAEDLEELGHAAYLVEIGGELRAGRGKPGERREEPWRVAIERPTETASGDRAVQEVVRLEQLSMATSGDYRTYYLADGRRLSHTIDPRSGHPIGHALASVTVLHPEAMFADALATALNVLGPDAGYQLAQEQGLPAYFMIRRIDGTFESRETEPFSALRVLAERSEPLQTERRE